ncbi:hypothetical protein K458DRAFT_381315 [Lentithecium fluviatile CBS 122367]|uniref:Uncharacterized protein n=1 Tax=Lentithecium fluviatile CBS 122367 TaxID=1168545 RepID=A0A6G1JMK9_9PLEO|nr:hypothetical protein K458DRAFT_381315 [Lentithecium fluviatile CBS 122367]
MLSQLCKWVSGGRFVIVLPVLCDVETKVLKKGREVRDCVRIPVAMERMCMLEMSIRREFFFIPHEPGARTGGVPFPASIFPYLNVITSASYLFAQELCKTFVSLQMANERFGNGISDWQCGTAPPVQAISWSSRESREERYSLRTGKPNGEKPSPVVVPSDMSRH